MGLKDSEKKETKILSAHFNIYIYTLALTHIHTTTENFAEVLKSPQRTLFVRFLFHGYIISATTTVAAIAGEGTGSISSITQSCWHSCCTGSCSLCGVARMLLWLWAIIRVLRCPRGAPRSSHRMDLCEETGARLIFCIVF